MKPINPKLARLAGYCAPIWWLLGLLDGGRATRTASPPASILVFDFHLLGDIVLLTPFLKALRTGFPSARITLVAGPWAAELLQGAGEVDELIPFSAPWVKYHQGWRGWLQCWRLARQLGERKFDLGIEMRGDVRQILLLWLSGARRRVGFDFTGGGPLLTDVVPDNGRLAHLANHHQRIAEHLGIWPQQQSYRPMLRLTPQEIAAAEKIEPFIGLHFGASLPLRRMPQSEISLLITRLLSLDDPLCIICPPGEHSIMSRLVASLTVEAQSRIELWSGDLREFMVKVSRARHFYAMDSGPAHIVAALGVPVTVFFGPAQPDYVRPLGGHVQITSLPVVPCRPCDQVHCTHHEYQFCMKGLANLAPLPNTRTIAGQNT